MKILKYFEEKINPRTRNHQICSTGLNPVVKFGNAQDAQPSVIAKFYYRVKTHKEELFLVLIICLSGLFGFGMGRLSKLNERKIPITIEQPEIIQNNNQTELSEAKEYFVASKNGKKYYFPWCAGVDRISKNNIVQFNTREEAEKAGYEKAANCPGL